jgi:hypothetical protein
MFQAFLELFRPLTANVMSQTSVRTGTLTGLEEMSCSPRKCPFLISQDLITTWETTMAPHPQGARDIDWTSLLTMKPQRRRTVTLKDSLTCDTEPVDE